MYGLTKYGKCSICKKGFEDCPHTWSQREQHDIRKSHAVQRERKIKNAMKGIEDDQVITKAMLINILKELL